MSADLQHYLDATRAHIIAQGKPAAVPTRRTTGVSLVDCLYLTDDGLRCAVGCHIPILTLEEAAPDKNDYGLTEVLDLIGVGDEYTFFGDLQGAHDGSSPRSVDGPDDGECNYSRDELIAWRDERMAEIGFVEGDPLAEHAAGVWVTNTLARLDAVAKLHGLN